MTIDESKVLTLDETVLVTDPKTNAQIEGTVKSLVEDGNGDVTVNVEYATIAETTFAIAYVANFELTEEETTESTTVEGASEEVTEGTEVTK